MVVEGMITNTPGNRTVLLGSGLIPAPRSAATTCVVRVLALKTEVHDVVSTDGADVDVNVP
jgi:hypothetical protein